MHIFGYEHPQVIPSASDVEAFNTGHIGTISTGTLRANCVTSMYHWAVSPANLKSLVHNEQGFENGGKQLESNQPESG